MKISELISDFQVYTSKEDRDILKKMSEPLPLSMFTDREQVVIENLIRRGLVIKIGQRDAMVVRNEID